jgi:FkbM family methyltransferase
MIDTIKYYYKRFGINGIIGIIKTKFTKTEVLIRVDRKEIKFPFYLRDQTSDIPTFDQIFLKEEYSFSPYKSPRIIVDAGANIGLTSIYFANKYPEAKIISIEPEKSNYKLLKKNIDQYNNIVAYHAALWNKNEMINLVDPGLGKWGFMTTNNENNNEILESNTCHEVQGLTVDRIMNMNDLKEIDILKIDIEGSEREVFLNSSDWIEKINIIIIELHEQMRTGCNSSFYNGTSGFDDEWTQGENIFLSRQSL